VVSQLEYKKRIASTKNLQKIFSAQELIAASRITKARDLAVASRPYADAITTAVTQVATNTTIVHPLTAGRESMGHKLTNRVAVLCIASDRGMAGSYSATVIRTTEVLCNKLQEQGKVPVIFASGRRAVSYYKFRGREVASSWEGNSDAPEFSRAKDIARTLVDAFLSDDEVAAVDELLIVSTEFVNMVTQRPKIVRMLPLAVVDDNGDGIDDELGTSIDKHLLGNSQVNQSDRDVTANRQPEVFPLYHFEPGEQEVLNVILPQYISARVHACLLESAASETASRQRAMHTATDNAKDLIDELIRKSNQARQAGITQELTEIVSSADALNEV
jgi:F-type H+-transporting ATPase subunit gamma